VHSGLLLPQLGRPIEIKLVVVVLLKLLVQALMMVVQVVVL
jgi:hypothetical protein